ncbi:hypothetical protein DXZ75_28745 [Streptomyces sp. AcE210]|nr:hypothetical protein DXZ75_28745 [Streptomyces sp. AcE210]
MPAWPQQPTDRDEGRCAAVVEGFSEAVAGVGGLQAQPSVEPVGLPGSFQDQLGQNGVQAVALGLGAQTLVGFRA